MRAWIIYIYIANNRIVKLDGKGYCKAKVKMGEVEMFFFVDIDPKNVNWFHLLE